MWRSENVLFLSEIFWLFRFALFFCWTTSNVLSISITWVVGAAAAVAVAFTLNLWPAIFHIFRVYICVGKFFCRFVRQIMSGLFVFRFWLTCMSCKLSRFAFISSMITFADIAHCELKKKKKKKTKPNKWPITEFSPLKHNVFNQCHIQNKYFVLISIDVLIWIVHW